MYFMLPAYLANMAPVILKKIIPKLAFPLDFNKTLNNKPIFGKNKTFRGLVFAIIFAIIISFLQFYFFDYFKEISIYNYQNWLLFGFLMGFGAIFGDLIESFIKRRLNKEPGQRFIPWDQLDFTIGSLLFASIVYTPSLNIIIACLIISFVGHILVNHSAYYLRLRKEKW